MDIEKLFTEAIVWKNNVGWFFQENYNGLFEVEWKSKVCRYLASVPNEEMCMAALYAAVVNYENCLVLVPYMAEEIAIYDIDQGIFQKIELRNYGRKTIKEKFADFVCYGKYIFFIPACYPAIVRLDMEKMELVYLNECIEELEKHRINPKYLLNTRPVVWQETFWVGCYAANYLVEFNMETLQFSLHKIENCQSGIACSCYDGKRFWILQYPQLKIISWNPITGEEEIYDKYPDKFQAEQHSFLFAFYDGNRVLLLPYHANMILEINPESGHISGKQRNDIGKGENDKILYWTYFEYNHKYYYVTGDGRIVSLAGNLWEEETSRLQIEKEDIDVIIQKMAYELKDVILCDENAIGLNIFIRSIMTPEKKRGKENEFESNMHCGKRIWNCLQN